uniref:BTB domain-containing protein n=2 Tax=Schistosoma mansoni TaxID=6183 RepID=A0A5K4FA75_SCHMA
MQDNHCTNKEDLSKSIEGIQPNHLNKCNHIIEDINHTNNNRNEFDIMKRSNSCIYNSFYNSRLSPLKRSFPCDKSSYHVWKPVSTFVTNLQSKLLNHSKSEQTNQLVNHKPNINHLGRFNVGCPTGCNSSIADVSMNDDYELYTDIIQSTELLSNHEHQSIQPELNAHKSHMRSPQFMENDHLSKTYTGTTKAPVIVRLNVSGTIFHVRHSTLKHDPFVYGKMLEDAIWIDKTKEYYFERDPEVFRFILNYLRRGELHLPHGMCGPIVEKELDDWGIALGLDIQRCCLGPVMESKSKLESLHRFEEKLEPDAVRPDYWIQSYRWQSFREKIWSVIDISPRLINSRFTTNKHRRHYLPNELFPNEYSSTSDQSNPNDTSLNSTNNHITNPTDHFNHDYSIDNEQLNNNNNNNTPSGCSSEPKSFELPTMTSMNLCCHNKFNPANNKCPAIFSSYSSSTNHESVYLTWLRRFYFIYETLIITSAVGVFMLSTVKDFRVPFHLNITEYTDLYNETISDYNNHIEATINSNSYRTNNSYFTLPSKWLVQMDIFFSIAITIDVIIRMIFCPSIMLWFFSLSTLIDILSLIPFYCEFIFYELVYNNNNNSEAIWWLIRVLRVEEYFVVLKVFVVLRLFRLLRRHKGTRVLFYTIRTTITDLSIIILLILVSALFFGAAIYFVDSTFSDIPKGFWWALITMSTVGYGDLVPNNTWGYIVATACIILGTLLMSYTIPVLVNHFLLYYAHADQLSMVKQLHRTAKRKIRNRKMSRYLQKALLNAKSIVNATITNVNNKTITEIHK